MGLRFDDDGGEDVDSHGVQLIKSSDVAFEFS